MQLTYQARGGRPTRPANRAPSLLEQIPVPSPAEVWPWGSEADWRPRAEAHLRDLEQRHQDAQKRTAAMRVDLVALGERIERGRQMIGQPDARPEWRSLLDELEATWADRSAAFSVACADRDVLADDFCRKLAGYEKLVDVEDGYPAQRRAS